jgi:predicted dehydrogenase
MIHNLAEEIPTAIPLKPHDDLWPIPEAAWWQSGDFYRKFARAFADIARDIEDGHEPDPHNVAEGIALHLALDAAAGSSLMKGLSWTFSRGNA